MRRWTDMILVGVVTAVACAAGCRTAPSVSVTDSALQRLETQVAALSNAVDRVGVSIRVLERHLIGIEQFNRMVDEMRYEPVVVEHLVGGPDGETNRTPNQASEDIGAGAPNPQR